MFFILSKILFYLVMPLTWILALLLVAIFSKKDKKRKTALIAATTLLLIFSNPFLCNEAWLIWEHPATPINKLRRYDAAIILTGFTNQNKSPHDRIYTNKGTDRVLMPIRLYKEGFIKKIIIAGGSGSIIQKHSSEAEEVRNILIQSGIPAASILCEDQSRNTYENARFTKRLLNNHPELNTLLLVTSAFHIKRALGCFEKAGIHADAFSTDFYSSDRSFTPDKFVPQEASLSQWQKLIHEITGYVVYKIAGYI